MVVVTRRCRFCFLTCWQSCAHSSTHSLASILQCAPPPYGRHESCWCDDDCDPEERMQKSHRHMSDYVLHNFASQQYRRVLAPALFIGMPDRIRCSDKPCMQEDFQIRALDHPHQPPGCCREANQYGTPRTEPPSALLVSLDSSEAMSEHEAARRQILRSGWRLDSEFFFRDGVVIQDRPPAREICT